MSSVHALQKSTTRGKLLESVRTLRPLLSAALIQECDGDGGSFLPTADEQAHLHHHRSQDCAASNTFHDTHHHQGYVNRNGTKLYHSHPQHDLHQQQPKSQEQHGFDYQGHHYYGLHHHRRQGHGHDGNTNVTDFFHDSLELEALNHADGDGNSANAHAHANVFYTGQGEDYSAPPIINGHIDHHGSLQSTIVNSASITMPPHEDLGFAGQRQPATQLDSMEESMLLLLSTPDSQSCDHCGLPTSPPSEASDALLNTISHDELHIRHHLLLHHPKNHEVISSEENVWLELANPVLSTCSEWTPQAKEDRWVPASSSSTASMKVPVLSNSHELTRCKSASGVSRQIMEFSDDNDAMEDEDAHEAFNGKVIMGSKNLVSERKRRKKLNERLYSLRAVVPRISKLDKASIVSDTVGYVQELQKQVKEIESDILELQAGNGGEATQEGLSQLRSQVSQEANTCTHNNMPTNKIVELNVYKMEENTYHLGVQCKRGAGVLVQLTKAVEALDCDIIHASLATSGDRVINTIVVKITNDNEELKPVELRERFVGVAPMYALEF